MIRDLDSPFFDATATLTLLPYSVGPWSKRSREPNSGTGWVGVDLGRLTWRGGMNSISVWTRVGPHTAETLQLIAMLD